MTLSSKYSINFRNIASELIEYMHLLKEGYRIKDKITIFLYILFAPYRFYYRSYGNKPRHQYIRDIILNNSDGLFDCGRSFISSRIVSESYEKELKKFLNLKEGIFVDVGAHIGKYSISLGKRLGDNGSVISIEPEPLNFNLLKKNIALNHLSNIKLQNVACANHNSYEMLYIHHDYPTLHSFYINPGSKRMKVKTIKLDTLIQNLGVNRVDLMKIDVEGAEIDVIKGSLDILKKYHPKIVFEAFNMEYLKQIEKIFKNFNYSIRQIKQKNYIAY